MALLNRAYLGLGCNIGECIDNLTLACEKIRERGCIITGESSIYRTEPIGYAAQSDFINCIITVDTSRSPEELLFMCKEIEHEMKRKETVRWGPRIIDIDIILYNDIILQSKDLIIPHKELKLRYFWLYMLDEMNADMILPGLGQTAQALMTAFSLKQRIEFIKHVNYSNRS